MQTSNHCACSCIIPFYNENARIFSVINSLAHVKNLSEIICVDDGSASRAIADEIEKKFPNVILVRQVKNGGKSAAVHAGLSCVKTPYVMLMDADLDHVIPSEIEHGIDAIIKDPGVDLIIFRRTSDPWVGRMLRGDVLVSGDRILRAIDLENAFNAHPQGFQLEYAINFYMMKHKKNAYWVLYSAQNNFKIHKRGLVKGAVGELTMYLHLLQFAGVWIALQSLLFFCKKEYK